MSDNIAGCYITRDAVIEHYQLNENEQVYLADEILKIELQVFNYLKTLT